MFQLAEASNERCHTKRSSVPRSSMHEHFKCNHQCVAATQEAAARELYNSAGNICISGTATQVGNFAMYRIVSATSMKRLREDFRGELFCSLLHQLHVRETRANHECPMPFFRWCLPRGLRWPDRRRPSRSPFRPSRLFQAHRMCKTKHSSLGRLIGRTGKRRPFRILPYIRLAAFSRASVSLAQWRKPRRKRGQSPTMLGKQSKARPE